MNRKILNPMPAGRTWPNRGEYHTSNVFDGSAKRTVRVGCPGCGGLASLDDHTIDEHGNVEPSLVCPYRCSFHESVTLGGWEALTA